MRKCGLKEILALVSPLLVSVLLCSEHARSDDLIAGIVAAEKNLHYRIELRVDSEHVSIDRTVHCHPYFFGEISSPFDIYYRPDRSALSARLANGSGVIVIVPNYCYYDQEISSGFIPPVAVVDNVSDPHRMDIYVSGTRLTSTSSAVQLIAFTAEITKSRESSGLSDEFAAWQVVNATAPSVFDALSFRSVIGYGVGFDSADSKAVSAAMDRSSGSNVVPAREPWGYWLSRHRGFDLGTLLDGYPRSLGVTPETDPGYSIVPFVLKADGRLWPDIGNRGVLTLYPDLGDKKTPWVPMIAMGTGTFGLGGSSNSALYLPDTKLVLVMSQASWAWARRPAKQP